MPSLDPKLSMAYGASGRLNLPASLDAGSGVADFTNKMAGKRKDAAHNDPDADGPARRTRSHSSRSPSADRNDQSNGRSNPHAGHGSQTAGKRAAFSLNTIDEEPGTSASNQASANQALQGSANRGQQAAAQQTSATQGQQGQNPGYESEAGVTFSSASNATHGNTTYAGTVGSNSHANPDQGHLSASNPGHGQGHSSGANPGIGQGRSSSHQSDTHSNTISNQGRGTYRFRDITSRPSRRFPRDFRPAWFDTFKRSPYRRFITMLPLALLLLLTAMVMATDSTTAKANSSALGRVKANVVTTWSHLTSKNNKPVGFEEIQKLSQQISELEKQFKTLSYSNTLHTDTIAELQRILPSSIAVRKVAPASAIPDNFWPAIREKTQLESGSRVDAPAWDAFLAKNKASIEALINTKGETIMDNAIATKRIVSSAEFIELLQQNYDSHQQNYDSLNLDLALFTKNLEHVSRNLQTEMRVQHASWWDNLQRATADITRDATRDATSQASKVAIERAQRSVIIAFRQVSKVQLDDLIEQNIMQNAADALRKVNFFSAALGARVEGGLSSPTQHVKRRFAVLKHIYGYFYGLDEANHHDAALRPWYEGGNCWCAAKPTDYELGGRVPKAQLAIKMPVPMFPTSIAIEHVPISGTLDITSAPMDLELWVQIKDAEHRELIGRTAASMIMFKEGTIDDPKGYISENGKDISRSSVGLPASYVRIASWRYDINGPNYVQTHDVDIELGDYGVTVQRAVVRARNNWGAEHTCFYRVRLHGMTESQLQEMKEAEFAQYENNGEQEDNGFGWQSDTRL